MDHSKCEAEKPVSKIDQPVFLTQDAEKKTADLHVIATLTTPKDERKTRDEREMVAALKASHIALMAMIALVFCVSMGAYFAGLIDDNLVGGSREFRVDGNLMVLFANLLLACVVLQPVGAKAHTDRRRRRP